MRLILEPHVWRDGTRPRPIAKPRQPYYMECNVVIQIHSKTFDDELSYIAIGRTVFRRIEYFQSTTKLLDDYITYYKKKREKQHNTHIH